MTFLMNNWRKTLSRYLNNSGININDHLLLLKYMLNNSTILLRRGILTGWLY